MLTNEASILQILSTTISRSTSSFTTNRLNSTFNKQYQQYASEGNQIESNNSATEVITN